MKSQWLLWEVNWSFHYAPSHQHFFSTHKLQYAFLCWMWLEITLPYLERVILTKKTPVVVILWCCFDFSLLFVFSRQVASARPFSSSAGTVCYVFLCLVYFLTTFVSRSAYCYVDPRFFFTKYLWEWKGLLLLLARLLALFSFIIVSFVLYSVFAAYSVMHALNAWPNPVIWIFRLVSCYYWLLVQDNWIFFLHVLCWLKNKYFVINI